MADAGRTPPSSSVLLPPPPPAGGLEGFTPLDGAQEAALARPHYPFTRDAQTDWPPTPATVVARYPRSGPVGAPSPWALAGLLPVGVLVGSGVYSTWWRRRPVPPL